MIVTAAPLPWSLSLLLLGALPLGLLFAGLAGVDLIGLWRVQRGRWALSLRASRKGFVMRKRLAIFGGVLMGALATAGSALAAPVIPAVPVATYGDTLLSSLGTAVGDVFPYAAAITAFAIGVGLVRRWLGAKKATRV